MKTHKYILLLLLLVFAESYEGLAQTETLKPGLPDERVIQLRTMLVSAIRNNNLDEATLSKNILIDNQPIKWKYLQYEDYYRVLFLIHDFNSILESYSDTKLNIDFSSSYPDISNDLKFELQKQKPLIISKINMEYNVFDRLKLRQDIEYLSGQNKPGSRHFFEGNTYTGNIPGSYLKDHKKNLIRKNDEQYLYLFNDSIIFCDEVEYERKFLKRNRFKCADTSILANKVKFYQDTYDFYANTKKDGKHHNFIERHSSGKINYYKIEGSYQTSGYYTAGTFDAITGMYRPGHYMPGVEGKVLIQYYNFGFEDVKKATYRNLMQDISHNPSSKYYLDEYRKKRRTENTVGIIGASLMLGGLPFMVSSPEITGITMLTGLTVLLFDILSLLSG